MDASKLFTMTDLIRTRPYEITEKEYVAAMIVHKRAGTVLLDLFAGVLVFAVARFVLNFDLARSFLMAPAPLIIGWFRMPFRVEKIAAHPYSNRPVGSITFSIDEEGIIYASSAVEPSILKWSELRSVKLSGGLYVLDAGFEELLVHPQAFETADDERKFQAETRKHVRKIRGF